MECEHDDNHSDEDVAYNSQHTVQLTGDCAIRWEVSSRSTSIALHRDYGTILTSAGKTKLKNAANASDSGPLDPTCGCPVCGRWSRACRFQADLCQVRLAGDVAAEDRSQKAREKSRHQSRLGRALNRSSAP